MPGSAVVSETKEIREKADARAARSLLARFGQIFVTPPAYRSPELVNELRHRRFVFFGLRGVLSFIVLALLVYCPTQISPQLWLLGTAFLASNLIILFLPLFWFRNPLVPYGAFFLDLAFLTVILYAVSGIDSESLLLYYLTVFMATLGEDVKKSVGIAFGASAVYVWLRLGGTGNLLTSPESLIRIPLFFVTALSSGHLAQQVRLHKRHVRDLKEIQNTLETELGRSVAELARSEDLRAIAQASLERFRNLVEDLDAIVWEADAPTLQFTFVGRPAQELLGYPIEDWLNKPNFWPEHIHPDDRDQAAGTLRQTLYAGRGYQLEYRMVAADGRTVWLRNIVRVVRTAVGQATHLRGVMVDVTELRRAQEALRESEERFKSFMDNGPALAFMKDPEGRLVYSNRTLQQAFRLHASECLGKNDFDLLPTEVAKELRDHDLKVLAENRTLEFIEAVPTPEGRLRQWWVFKFPFTDAAGRQLLGGMAVDVTERLRAEKELGRLSRQNELILNSAGEGIFGVDPEGNTTFVNSTAAKMLGWAVEDLVGRPMHAVTHHTRADGGPYPQDECPIYAAFKDGAVHHVADEVLWRKDKTSFPVEYVSTPILENGKVVGAVVTFKDITERKQLEEQLQQAQKMEAVGRLAGGVAHDFNNLLTIIGGYSQLLLQRLSPEDPSRGHVTEIKQAGERAGALTRQLLAFSRRQILTPQVLDLNDVVANIEKMLRRLIGEDVELITVQDPDLWRVKADPGQIEQVIMNLAVNARDAMPQGGKLTLETSNVTLDEHYGQSQVLVKPGSYIMLTVSDTGCGMTEEVQKHLFEPFFTTKEKGKGTGLGLAMVYGIVKQSGGYIWVQTQLGYGTSFSIHLPRVEEPGKAVEAAKLHEGLPRGTETVLVVEDEPAVRSLVRGVLQSTGYTVLEATHSVDAISLSEQHQGPIHLLLTDLVMPGLSGRELAEQMLIFQPSLKVVYMSGYTDDVLVQQDVLAAQASFLQKPFTPETLACKVREALDRA